MESQLDKFVRKFARKINPMWYLHYCWRKNYNDKRLDDFIQNNFTAEDGDLQAIKKVMKRYWLWRGIHHSDFHEMSLDKKCESERRLFVPRWEEVDLYFQVNDKRYIDILGNKGKCYEYFKDYYKREAVSVSVSDILEKKTRSEVSDFISSHSKFIIKPISLQGGKGIQIVEKQEALNADNILLEYMKQPNYSTGFVLEELIIQDERMAAFHPESVNTIRITTVNYGDTIDTKWPVLRMGRGDSIVDNAAAGGIVAALDERTGVIIRAADEQRGSTYQYHPDTHKPLIGVQIPDWENLCNTIKRMASLCPDCHIMGWDMSLTNNGWVVVECNYSPELLIQWALGRGVREDFDSVRTRLHAKKGKSYLHRRLEDYLSVPLNP